jgi:predicted metal-dependent hydrolase
MTLRNYQKSPQKSLFDAAIRPQAARWHDGAALDYLGSSLHLKLDTDKRQAVREHDVLHLPLPPDATPRQIQDAAESWLRREAEALFPLMIEKETTRLARQMPAFSLSFSLHGSWAKLDGRVLRLNWRLIEQPLSVIELTLRRAAALLPVEQAEADLFA